MRVCPSVWQLSTCSRLPIIETWAGGLGQTKNRHRTHRCWFPDKSVTKYLKAILEQSRIAKSRKQELKTFGAFRV